MEVKMNKPASEAKRPKQQNETKSTVDASKPWPSFLRFHFQLCMFVLCRAEGLCAVFCAPESTYEEAKVRGHADLASALYSYNVYFIRVLEPS